MKRDTDFLPQCVLCVAAHPDDLEFSVSGSVAKWVAAGAKVYYLICTDGSKGSDDRNITCQELTQIRRDEQREAAKILGVAEVTFLDYEDGTVEATMDLKRDIVREIRRVKPDTVICFDPTMVYSVSRSFVNHADHRAVGQATLDAVYPLARDHLSFPGLLEEGLEPHKTQTLLMANFNQANFAVDITSTFTTKLKALAAHDSQVTMDQTGGLVKEWAEACGRHCKCQLAEGYVRLDLPA